MLYRIAGTHNDSVGQLLAGHFGKNTDTIVHPPYSAMGWIKDGKVLGQAVFVDYTGSNIEVHLYAPRCFTRSTIKDVYNYVFNTLGCNRLTAKPKYNNEKLLQLLSRLGFEYEYCQEMYYGPPDAPLDALVYKLTKNNALRWLNA